MPKLAITKISVRDLFWLVLVVAILCGWWLEQREMTRLREETAKREKALHAVGVDMTAAQSSTFTFYVGFSR